MVSHETKRILGIGGLVLILIVLLVRILPLPFPGSHPFGFPRNPGGPNPYTPALIFNDTVSVTSGTPTFNLTLIQSHSYMWKFTVRPVPLRSNLLVLGPAIFFG